MLIMHSLILINLTSLILFSSQIVSTNTESIESKIGLQVPKGIVLQTLERKLLE